MPLNPDILANLNKSSMKVDDNEKQVWSQESQAVISDFDPTPWWSDYYGEIYLPVGSLIEAYDPDGIKCGEFRVHTEELYGFIHVYGDDPTTEKDEGAVSGDVITFKHGDVVIAVTSEENTWKGDKEPINFNIGEIVGIGSEELLPKTYEMSNNLPNPFNPVTTIRYQLPEPGDVRINIYNILGQKVRSLVERAHQAGFHEVTWNSKDDVGKSVSSGVYLFKIEILGIEEERKFSSVKKMVLLK